MHEVIAQWGRTILSRKVLHSHKTRMHQRKWGKGASSRTRLSLFRKKKITSKQSERKVTSKQCDGEKSAQRVERRWSVALNWTKLLAT